MALILVSGGCVRQLRRDAVEDSILERIKLPLLWLRTTESGEEARIRKALAAAGA